MATKLNPYKLPTPQSGLALIVIIVVIVIGAAGVFMANVNFKQRQTTVNITTMKDLKRAKNAIIGWAVSHPDRPGMLPWPDRRNDSNYDGNSDCANINLTQPYTNLLDRMPWLGQNSSAIACKAPLTGIGVKSIDTTGAPIYYAASPNLVYDYTGAGQYPVINSSTRIINNGYPNNGWLKVFDRSGNLLNDRVAFVVIAPGRALRNSPNNQTRPAPPAPPPSLTMYLDRITINSTTFDNANNDGVFITGQPNEYFNDLVQYVTIDQLIDVVEKRILSEYRKCMNNPTLNASGTYPFPESPPGTINCILSGYNKPYWLLWK